MDYFYCIDIIFNLFNYKLKANQFVSYNHECYRSLKELGYSEITQENSTEVYEKMAEIQSRNI